MSNIFGTIGLVNINVNSVNNSPILTPITYFVRTINGVRRTSVYLDDNLFTNPVLLSVSLLIGDDLTPFKYHYNTTHDENLGISGTAWKPLEDIVVSIFPKPLTTNIEGLKRMDVNTTHQYNVPITYDMNNLFTYNWYIIGSGNFPDNSNSQTFLNGGRSVSINFTAIDTVTIKLLITNQSGCFRWIIRNVYPGTSTKKLLVVRYPYF